MEFDFGVLGEQTVSVKQSTDYYAVDVEYFFDKGPLGAHALDEVVDDLETIAAKMEELESAPTPSTITEYLDDMHSNGNPEEKELAHVLLEVVKGMEFMRSRTRVVSVASEIPDSPRP